MREQGPALLFENADAAASMPLAINVFGTDAADGHGARASSDLDEIGERIGDLLKPELPHGVGGLRDALGKVGAAARRAARSG